MAETNALSSATEQSALNSSTREGLHTMPAYSIPQLLICKYCDDFHQKSMSSLLMHSSLHIIRRAILYASALLCFDSVVASLQKSHISQGTVSARIKHVCLTWPPPTAPKFDAIYGCWLHSCRTPFLASGLLQDAQSCEHTDGK